MPPSAGSQTAQGEAVGFETEATAILDTMSYVRPDIYTLVSCSVGMLGRTTSGLCCMLVEVHVVKYLFERVIVA